LPSPLARKEIAFLLERFAGCIIAAPGEKKAPAHRGCGRSSTVPLIWSAPFEPSAPPGTSRKLALDLPPMRLSVETDQPLPHADSCVSPAKAVTSPVSEPVGAGIFFARASASLCFSRALR